MSLTVDIFTAVDSNYPVPVADQLVDVIRKSVGFNHLSPGDSLPSVGTLSDRFDVTPTIVEEAYGRLIEEQVLERTENDKIIVSEEPVTDSVRITKEAFQTTVRSVYRK